MKWLITISLLISVLALGMPQAAMADAAKMHSSVPTVTQRSASDRASGISGVTEGYDFSENFDSYTAGTQLVVQNSTDWETWSGGSGTGEDPYVSAAQSESSPNSVVIANLNDAVKAFGTLTEGVWDLTWRMYVPTGKAGYFNTLALWAGTGSNWAMEAYFNVGGDGSLNAGAVSAATFNYTQGEWIDVQLIVDLDTDFAKFVLEGVEVYGWQWTLGANGAGSPLQLEANDFYGATASDEMYVDNYHIGLQGVNPDEFLENFDTYTAGVQLVSQNGTDWDTWSNMPGSAEDPFVSSAHSFSGANAVVIAQNNDLIRRHGERTTGSWGISFQAYIPAGKAGYFNTLSGFIPNPNYWAMEVYFDAGGAGRLIPDGATVDFTWTEDTWQLVEVIVDLDQDQAQFVLDGTVIQQWQWTGGGGPLVLDANDFFGATANDEFYFDDYSFKADTLRPLVDPNTFIETFDTYTAGVQLVSQNGTDWDTWSNMPGSAEDPFVSDAYSTSGSNSVVIAQNNDLIRRHGSRTTGSWGISFQMYIPVGKTGYFNTMSGFDPNPNYWAMEVHFEPGGAGRLVSDVPVTSFTWTEGTWQLVEVIVDLDQDLAQFVLDGAVIHQWQWTTGASGGTGPLQLDANDFFGATANDEMYFDDYTFMADTLRSTVDVSDPTASIPVEYNLVQNYPNPFNPSTRIAYALPEQASVTLRIYNLLGQEVITLADKVQEAGQYEVLWNARNKDGQSVGTGVYFYRLEAKGTSGEVYTDFKKMLFLK